MIFRFTGDLEKIFFSDKHKIGFSKAGKLLFMDAPPPPAPPLRRRFSTMALNYCTLLHTQAAAGTWDLEDEIDEKEYLRLPYHAICRLRKAKGLISLYQTASLWQWLSQNPSHPETRGPVHLAMVRIKAKTEWARLFPGVKLADLTPAFRAQALDDFRRKRGSEITCRERARAFVDIATLHEAGMLQPIDFDRTNWTLSHQPASKWMLRFSSMHDSKMFPKTQIIVIATGSRTSKIFQMRILNVEGICFFLMLNGNLPTDVSELAFADMALIPCACCLDAIQLVLDKFKLTWQDFVDC